MSKTFPVMLERIAVAGKAYQREDIGSREELIKLGRDVVAALEIPILQPAPSAHCRLAAQVGLFQHLKYAGETGSSLEDLAQDTRVDALLLQGILRHLVAMKLFTYSNGKFQGTPLSNGLAAENCQKSIDFCYDVARSSFNRFPSFFQETGSKITSSVTNGLFQAAHGFYPVAERLIEGFDKDVGEALLVDVGGGRGHHVEQFISEHKAHPGKTVLKDREPVVISVSNQDKLPFELQVHDFFTTQPIKAAWTYSLHSILHDWNDEGGIKILDSLKPALESRYSRVLLIEIVEEEEEGKPTIAETAMDMMMLAHFAVRERTRVEWEGIIEKAGLRLVGFYNFLGVAESIIEAELREAP
ncbi:hypothetical protein COCMIDRAFT_32379 [Bipolaris oryzae ATCC 44560]|uniref:O-methyltransferase C-terminal domain-containing protein n=1 Tax=Bipolaris oryzae ATCC 44560 TaxID=930090 RepID=W6ZJR4_COCMI|nr:uncharacterized protein COCMIDRAFT_32379 [Bipolaris oryzae ATCC 44560]EUC50285.1 hypothetical protein COCMIDRAFT_32379 [Bipolaris oryzae ATCC 44560]